MHIETLKIFCDLAELRSFSKTAERNILSQSAVSQQIAQLELTHKIQLIDREKRPLELTTAGQLFYRSAKEMFDKYEHLRSELKSLQKSSENRINIGAIFSIGMHTLPNYVKEFMIKYPEVNIHIEYFSAARIYELILSGELDIGLVAVPKRDKMLDVYDLDDERLVLACSSNHAWAGESEMDIHRVQFERFIGFEKKTPTREWIDNILQRYNVTVNSVMEFDNIETIKRAVEINSGVSILPETAIEQEVSSGTIKGIPFSNENFVRPTGIIVRKNKIHNKISREFIKLLSKEEEL